jgi:hypothetical protein
VAALEMKAKVTTAVLFVCSAISIVWLLLTPQGDCAWAFVTIRWRDYYRVSLYKRPLQVSERNPLQVDCCNEDDIAPNPPMSDIAI